MGQRRRSYLSPGPQRVSGSRGSDVSRDTGLTSYYEGQVMFPGWAPWAVLGVTLLIRLAYVRQRQNWWILHPDEVYQGIEVAFSLLTGFGFRMYEYLPPFSNISSPAAEREAYLGFHSLRSFLYPELLAACTRLLCVLGLADTPFLTLKTVHAAVAACLCATVYRLTHSLTSSHDTSVVAAIFAATSLPLTVFGTHSLTNSFLAPLFIMAITPLVTLLVKGESLEEERCERDDQSSDNQKKSAKINGLNKRVITGNDASNDAQNCNSKIAGCRKGNSKNAEPFNGMVKNKCEVDSNSNHSKSKNGFIHRKEATRPVYDVRMSSVLSTCLKCFLRLDELLQKHFSKDHFYAGFIMGLVCYIRVDLLLCLVCFLVSLALFTLIIRHTVAMPSKELLILYSVGTTCGILVGGVDDYRHYGHWFLSPVQWIRFNVVQNLSGKVFGVESLDYYMGEFFDRPSCLCLNALCYVYFVLVWFLRDKSQKVARLCSSALLITVVSLTAVYSFQSHKELRLLHNVFVFQSILWAVTVRGLVGLCKENFSWFSVGFARAAVVSVLIVHALDSYRHFPASYDRSNQQWAYGQVWDSALANECLERVSQQTTVRGILLDYSLYSLGGFTLLAHNVPVLARLHYEYFEYRPDDLALYRHDIDPNLRVINRMSDVIHVRHEEFLRVVVSGSVQYNFILTATPQRFTGVGFNTAFRCGHIHVLQKDDYIKSSLQERLKDGLVYTKDASVLEVEGSWLYSVGLYSKAEERLRECLKCSTERVRPYQLLAMSQAAMGKLQAARDTEKSCWDRHGPEACRSLQPRLVLHKEYDMGV